MPKIVLHVGAYKTGTTFLQHSLAANRDALAADGILYPGTKQRSHFGAVRQVRGVAVPHTRGGASWEELVDECLSWDGRLAVLSAENMSLARDSDADRLVAAFRGHPVSVVYGARDIARAVPSQWQTVIQNASGFAPTYSEYVQSVMQEDQSRSGRSFWQTNDWVEVLRTWAARTGPTEVTLLCVPPQGTAASLLWHRFGAAVGFDARRYPLGTMLNSSLGAQSAELIRHVSLALGRTRGAEQMRVARNAAVRSYARRYLAPRRAQEVGVVFPPTAADWALGRTHALKTRVESLGVNVVGSLDDLAPRPPSAVPACATIRPEALPSGEVLEAALDGLSRWGQKGQVEAIRSSASGVDDQLSSAVSHIAERLEAKVARRTAREM